MRIIQCPDSYKVKNNDRSIFLAGGISGCGNWQTEMIERFKHLSDKLVLINPRRTNFDITNPNESDIQIEWEFKHLCQANAILFWFPYETLCPITLFELGCQAFGGKPIFVGTHPAYERRFDVVKQLSLIRPGVVVRDNFQDLVSDAIHWYEKR